MYQLNCAVTAHMEKYVCRKMWVSFICLVLLL